MNQSLFVYTQLNSFKYHYLTLIILVNIVYTQLNGSNYCYVILIIQFNISHLFEHSWMASSREND